MWRKGPLGPKSLCNRCGIRYRKMKMKEEMEREGKRASEVHDDLFGRIQQREAVGVVGVLLGEELESFGFESQRKFLKSFGDLWRFRSDVVHF
ncbi:hypothetical protein FF1_005538 [Malus domestica]